MKLKSLVPAAAIAALALVPTGASAATLRVQSTTDTKDAGLVTGLLQSAFDAAFPGDKLDYVSTGTGKALENARTGIADVVITHAPSLEAQFVTDGFSLEPYGHAIFYSDYVIIGPASDPAGVLTAAPHDAVAAFEAIAAAGADGKATFISRGENSGTNVQEQVIWGLSNVDRQRASNAGTDTTRSEPAVDASYPGGGGPYPAWYKKTGKGQAANVQDTDVCAAASYPNGGCYTMVDRGTFNRLVNEQGISKLKTVADKNTPAARGGENLLINPFSAYIVNPDKFTGATKDKFNLPMAQRFIDLLVSPDFQAAVSAYPSAADPAFRGDAFPTLAPATALPTTQTVGGAVPITITASNKLPGGGTIDGIPVQLQASTDGGSSYANVGAPATTDAAGKVSFAPTISATTTLRVAVPRYRQFTASSTVLGVVGATPAPSVLPPVVVKDSTKPAVSKAKLTGKKLSFTLSEAGTVKATIKRKVVKTTKKSGKTKRTTTYKTVKTFTFTATKASTVSRSIKTALKAGTYHVTLAATDKAGNKASRTVTLTIKATKKSSKSKAS